MKAPSFFLVCCCAALCGCSGKPSATAPSKEAAAPQEGSTAQVKKTDVKVGVGDRVVEAGDTAFMQYRGTLANGKLFDENMGKDKDPLVVAVGTGQVIKGWDLGLLGMKIGGERKLHIPAALGYGSNGRQPSIPPNADLDFDVKLLGLVKTGQEHVIDIVKVKPGAGSRAVKPGDTVTIKYKGFLLNEKQFESSDKPFTFKVGQSQMQALPAIDKGVQGMKVGETRRIISPPATAYLTAPNAPIDANQEVIFEIQLLAIK